MCLKRRLSHSQCQIEIDRVCYEPCSVDLASIKYHEIDRSEIYRLRSKDFGLKDNQIKKIIYQNINTNHP